jgi:short-subunit dehydrogenase
MARETALVTGASSGIGTDLARCFARDGADVVLLARSEDALRALAEELEAEHGVTAHVLPADLSAPDAAATIDAELDEREIAVDVLVNNAGYGARGRFAERDEDEQMGMVHVNVTALTQLTHRLLPAMIERGRGGVLNVASTAAFQPGPHMSVYYATKAYVLSFTEGLAGEVDGTGVTITCLAPGPTETSFADRADMRDTPLFEMDVAMSAADVAQAGYEGFRAGRTLVVPGLANKASVVLSRFTPRRLARKITGWLQERE